MNPRAVLHVFSKADDQFPSPNGHIYGYPSVEAAREAKRQLSADLRGEVAKVVDASQQFSTPNNPTHVLFSEAIAYNEPERAGAVLTSDPAMADLAGSFAAGEGAEFTHAVLPLEEPSV